MKLILKLINSFFHLVYLFHKNKIINFLNKKINPKIIFDVGAYHGKFGHSFTIIDFDWRYRFPLILPMIMLFSISLKIIFRLKKIHKNLQYLF